MTTWNRVSESLPELYKPVLAYRESEMWIAHVDDEDEWWHGYARKSRKPTHWTELPEKPEDVT